MYDAVILNAWSRASWHAGLYSTAKSKAEKALGNKGGFLANYATG
jgi:hypothetical protein